MNVQRPIHEGLCDLTVPPTLHIPVSSTFIPFSQFSVSDTSSIRNPADDNNNKTAVPVVSVVTAVSGMCPTINVVSMHHTAQLPQAVVAPTIIPTVVTPIAVQATSCLAPTTTMAVANTINISNHMSLPQLHQQPVFSIKAQTSGLISTVVNSSITGSHLHITSQPSGIKPTTTSPPSKTTTALPPSATVKLNNTPAVTTSVKPSTTNSKAPLTSSSSSQGVSSEQTDDLVKPVFKDGELVLEVECGQNKAVLYLSKLCQGSKGPCISFQSSWLTPNEFQFVSGRETAKDWKRSIRHHGKSLKLLLAKGILNVHPTMCDCDGCRQGATLTRKGEKRRIPNGERKPRKTSCHLGGGGGEAGSARPGGPSLMAAHFGSAGVVVPVKSDLKRPVGDKVKVGESSTQSQVMETSNIPPKHGLPIKSAPAQRPDSLGPARDLNKPKAVSTPSSPIVAAPTTLANISPTHPSASSTLNTLTAAISPSDMTALKLVQPIPAFTLMSQCISGTTNPAPHTTFPLSFSLTGSPATPLTSSQGAVTAMAQELSTGLPSSNPGTTEMLSPNLPNSKQAHTPCFSSGCDSIQPLDRRDDVVGDCNLDPENSDEENSVDNEVDDSFISDDRSDIMDDESDDEHSECLSKDSESKDPTSDDQILPSASSKATSLEADILRESEQNKELGFIEGLTDCVPEASENLDIQEQDRARESLNQYPNVNVKDDSFKLSENSPTPMSTSAITTLAISSVSGACSKPVGLSISTTNIKSEHIWVPPTLQPLADGHDFHRIPHESNSAMSPTNPPSHQTNGQPKEGHNSIPNKDILKHNTSRKPQHPSGPNDPGHRQSVDGISDVAHTPNAIHEDRQTAHFAHKSEAETKIGRPDLSRSEVHPTLHAVSRERGTRDKEREERYRQRMKEDKNRREKEERSRKDKEREDRREREKREENEAERLRQDEKERKAQAEGKSHKERSAGASSSDPYRRPPGGVVEAAAFSDYMRVLAAGHGHAFMPHTQGYMSSVFPIRTQEPTHLLHPMTAFGPQLNSIHKDAILYQTTAGALPNFASSSYGPLHPLLQRPPYTTQQSIIDYQRSLAAAASYPWPAAYPYFFHDMTSSSSSAVSTASTMTPGGKRASTELEASVELNAKRMRLDGRHTDTQYPSSWDYFAAASQQLRAPVMSPALPCGLESTSADKTAEFLRKRYMEYWPQAAAYLSSLPEYARSAYYCACADHRDEDIRMWSVEDVCKFLTTLEGCAVYAEHFREQRVNGRILCILTPDHLVKAMGMKLSPAVVLAEAVAKKVQDTSKMSNCEACRSIYQSHHMHPMVLPL